MGQGLYRDLSRKFARNVGLSLSRGPPSFFSGCHCPELCPSFSGQKLYRYPRRGFATLSFDYAAALKVILGLSLFTYV